MTNCWRAINIYPFPSALTKRSIYKPALRAKNLDMCHDRVHLSPIQHLLREGAWTVPVPRGLILNQDGNLSPRRSPWKDNSKIRGAQHDPNYGPDESGLEFSLEACEERRFVQASEYSSMPNLSVLSILRRRSYRDLYQSCRGEIFFLSQKLGQVEGHHRCFFPTRAGEVQRESQMFTRWVQRGPERVLGKRAFLLRDRMPALN